MTEVQQVLLTIWLLVMLILKALEVGIAIMQATQQKAHFNGVQERDRRMG